MRADGRNGEPNYDELPLQPVDGAAPQKRHGNKRPRAAAAAASDSGFENDENEDVNPYAALSPADRTPGSGGGGRGHKRPASDLGADSEEEEPRMFDAAPPLEDEDMGFLQQPEFELAAGPPEGAPAASESEGVFHIE